ncbi:MAG: hypothetical protein HZB29_02545 [Nitrospinae bacterium]|nr:hypothetical protein [Nitrospinota bacterium]
MKKIWTLAAAFLAATLSSCATDEAVVRGGGGSTIAQAQAEKYNGPKARVAVVKFIDKTGKAKGEIGEGMADMLTTALFNTNRYILLDRRDLDAVINEQDFAVKGQVSAATAAKTGQLEGADLLVFGAVTAFEEDELGAGGIIVGAITLGASIAVGAANQKDNLPIGAVTYTESYIAMDMKIVDARTGRVVAANTVEGRSQNWGGGVIGGVGGGWSRAPIGLGGWSGTSVEAAARVCVEAAVRDMARNTPWEYYRYAETMDMTPIGKIAQLDPLVLPNASAAGVAGPQAMLIDNQESYQKLLVDLKVAEAYAPAFDWRYTRLIAVFAGEKQVKGHRIGVEKAVDRGKEMEVTVRQTVPLDMKNAPHGPEWPYEIVSLPNPGKPVRFIWPK